MTREEILDERIAEAQDKAWDMSWDDSLVNYHVDCKDGTIAVEFITTDDVVYPHELRRALTNVIILEGIIEGGSTSADLCIPNVEQVESFEQTPEGKGWVRDESN